MKLAPGPRGLFAHATNNAPYLADDVQDRIARLVLPDPTCCGTQLNVPWSEVETSQGTYNWDFVLKFAKPWIDARKLVNLVFYGSPTNQRQLYGGKSPCPGYVLSAVNKVSCPHTGVITPIYWEEAYKENYKKLISAGLSRFQSEPWVGYLRFGIGSVGEDFPALKIPDGDDECSKIWAAFGLSVETWTGYTLEIIDYIASQKPSKPILLPINIFHRGDLSVAQAVADRAAKYRYGFGSQGFGGQAALTGKYTPFGQLFKRYAGIVPLEIQTATNTGPQSREGLLPPLVDAAIDLNIQVYELYINEWFIANRPGPYSAQYKAALKKAFDAIGGCGMQ
jgi:hypothetical protein